MKQTLTADNYVSKVLKKIAATTMQWKRENEPPTEVKLLPDMSRAILRQDGAPAHHGRKTQPQDWCPASFPDFWGKRTWPGNSSDLSPIENLWAIVKEELSKLSPASLEKVPFQNAQTPWRSAKGDTLRLPDMWHAGGDTEVF